MLPRKASYKTIFGAQQKDLLSLNAFSEAVADDEKYRLPEGISIRRVEYGSCTSAMLLQERSYQLLERIVMVYQPNQYAEPRVQDDVYEEQLLIEPTPFDYELPIEESPHFLYKEYHSELSGHGYAVDYLLGRIEESSIDIRYSSYWVEEPRLHIPNPPMRNTQINEYRKRIEEEKLRIERYRGELDRKRTYIEAMLREYYQLRESSNKDSETTIHRSQLSIHNTSSSPERSRYQTFATPIQQRSILPPKYSIQRFQTAKEQPRSYRYYYNQKLKGASKQKKARQALVLETLWINLIRHHNELRILREQLLIGAMNTLKYNCKVEKIVSAIGSVVYSSNFKDVGEAFLKLKVNIRYAKKKDPPKKNIVIKFAKKEIKYRESLAVNKPERVCNTEASRTERVSEIVYTEMGSDSISYEFDRVTLKSNSSRVAEIDMIIRNQMVRAKQQKVLRELSTNQLLNVADYPKSAACSGNVTSRACNRTIQQHKPMAVALKIPVNVSASSHSRQESSTCKRIVLWRK